MRRLPITILAVLLGSLVLSATACGGSSAKRAAPAAGAPTGDKPKERTNKIGGPCASDKPFERGDCAEGLMCLPLNGGHCSKFCGGGDACDEQSACVETIRGGELCERTCKTDKDCRTKKGYTCDPDWHTCTQPGLNAPKAPVCEPTPALPRKTFAKVDQVSDAKSAGAYQFEPKGALDLNGDLVAAWISLGKTPAAGEKNVLGIGRVDAKGAVDGAGTFTSDREDHFDPWMAADRNGKLFLVWLGFDGGHAPEKHMQIGLASSADGGKTWSKPVSAHDAKVDCPNEAPGCLDKPMVAVGTSRLDPKQDVVYVFYYSEPGGGLKATHSTDGGQTFSPSVLVGDGAYGHVEISDSGKVHVVYVGSGPPADAGPGAAATAEEGPPPNLFGDKRNAVYYANSGDDGATFSKPIKVSGDEESIPFFFSNPQVLVDVKAKLLYVIYPTGTPDGRWDLMLATSRDAGVSWSRIKINDDSHCASHMLPEAVLDKKTGKLHVMWTENRNGAGQLAYTACDQGGGKCAPNEALGDKPFAAFSLSRFTTKWLGEYGTIVIDPKKHVLHAMWTQTVDENGVPTSRIFHAKAVLK